MCRLVHEDVGRTRPAVLFEQVVHQRRRLRVCCCWPTMDGLSQLVSQTRMLLPSLSTNTTRTSCCAEQDSGVASTEMSDDEVQHFHSPSSVSPTQMPKEEERRDEHQTTF
ncbi:hypothetical protein BLNAU_22660 [Blattamonas nauphoetae]|uniref:Uncharacterized protein n=1 Tax=Blattamonas nauphoetae TaxID=2049346 RepID=A0ABQ9WSG9_9EUKA|nr:hypothetical protein BLNAU_22660 [Blattamonas nauphoetae]